MEYSQNELKIWNKVLSLSLNHTMLKPTLTLTILLVQVCKQKHQAVMVIEVYHQRGMLSGIQTCITWL